MDLITSKNLRGGGNCLKFSVWDCKVEIGVQRSSGSIFWVVLALMMALPTFGEDRNWIGGLSEASPKFLYEQTNWDPSGNPGKGDKLHFNVGEGNSLVVTNNHTSANIANDIKVRNGEYTFLGALEFNTFYTLDSGSRNVVVKNGDWKLTYGFRLANGQNSYSVFTNMSGKLEYTNTKYFYIGDGKKSTGIIENQFGDWSIAHDLHIGYGESSRGEVYWRNGNLTFSKEKTLYIGHGQNSKASVEIYGGSWTTKGDCILGNSSGASGILTINDGSITVDSGKMMKSNDGSGTINLNGGTFVSQHIEDNGGVLTVNFNGGTLKANAENEAGLLYSKHDKLSAIVGAGGGTIDTDGKSVTIAAAITGTGSLSVVGGGTLTFSTAPAYTGKTFVAPGTKICASAAIVESILAHGLELSGVPALDTSCTILTSEEDLSGLSLAGVTCGIASDGGCTVSLGEDFKSIVVTCTAYRPAYYIGPADGNLSVDANWSDKTVPTGGNATFLCPSPATLVKGDVFAPSSITFAANSAKVTIVGDGVLSGITAITNLSPSANHEFRVAVAGGTVYFNTTTYCVFSGGITVSDADFSQSPSSAAGRMIAGRWEITKDKWIPQSYNEVKSGSILAVKNLYRPHNLVIQSDAIVIAETVETDTNGATITYRNNGILEATERYVASSWGSYFSRKPADDTDGVLKFKSVVDGTDKDVVVNCPTIAVGSDGFSFQKRANGNNPGHFRLGEKKRTTVILPMADYVFMPGFDNSVNYYDICGTVKIGTKDYGSEEQRIVTVNGIFLGEGSVEATGCGTLVFNSGSTFTGGLTVRDTATVQVNANCIPGSGTVTLCAGTTLALTSASSEFVPFNNTLYLPTEGFANIRIDGRRLSSGNHEIATIGAGDTANVALDSASVVLDGRRYSLKIEGGKLTLSIVPSGFKVIIR